MTRNASENGISASPAPGRTLPLPIILMAGLLAMLSLSGVYFLKMYPLLVGVLPVVFCAFLRPQAFLILAIALAPFTISLSGTKGSGAFAAFGFSDVLLFLALPGLLGKAFLRPSALRLHRLTVPILLYLVVSLLGFVYNIPEMRQASPASYFIGYVRTFQIVLILPLAFAVIEWEPGELRAVLYGYLIGGAFLGLVTVVAFALGLRKGAYVLGNHKNSTGLALALTSLIALAALTQPKNKAGDSKRALRPEELGISKNFLIAIIVLSVLGLLCSLSRGAYLCLFVGLFSLTLIRKRGRIFGIVLALASLGMFGLLILLPEKSAEYVTDISSKTDANYTRVEQSRKAIDRLQRSPLLGDGMRARKDFLPHNMEMMLLAENGLLGTAIFFWALLMQAAIFRQARKIFAEDPLRDWIAVSISLCSIALIVQSQFDPYWRRGPLWVPWAGTGLLLFMLAQERRARKRQEAEETPLPPPRRVPLPVPEAAEAAPAP